MPGKRLAATVLFLLLAGLGTALWFSTQPHIDRRRVYRMGFNDIQPYHSVNNRGEVTGLVGDVINEAARRAGVQIRWVNIPRHPGPAMMAGTVDLWSASSEPVFEDFPAIHLSKPWLRNDFVMVERFGEEQAGPEAVRRLSVPNLPVARRIAKERFSSSQVTVFDRGEEAWAAVCAGRDDAAVLEVRYAQYLSLHPPEGCSTARLHVTGLQYPRTGLSIAARAECADVAEILRDEIENMAETGVLERVLRPWVYYNANDAQAIYREYLATENIALAVAVASITAIATLIFWFLWRRARQHSQRAREARERLQQTLVDIQEIAWRCSVPSMKTTYVSPAFEAIHGRPAQRFYDSPDLWKDVMHPDDRARVQEVINQVVRGNKGQMQYRVLSSDGSERWIFDRVIPISDAHGNVTELNGFALDITDRVRAEAALRDSERRFRTLIERSSDLVNIIDPSGIVTFASPASLQTLGYKPEEMLGSHVLEFIHASDREHVLRVLAEVSGVPGGSGMLEIRARHRDGSPLTMECLLRNFLHDDLIKGVVATSRDITERKCAEQERELLISELELRNEELERFSYTVSHDLKSPLITIVGYLGFVEDSVDRGDMQRCRQDLGRIRAASQKLQTMLDELLELSRIGRLLQPKQDVAFSAIAHEAVELVQGELTASGARVEILTGMPVVHVDRTRAVEALQNLIENANKFSRNTTSPTITIGSREQDGEIVFFVRDNGIGIDQRHQDRVFGLFDKLDSKSEGTGIGLALVKRIVEIHGGRIWVESEGLGKGSTFCFTFSPEREDVVQRALEATHGK